MKQRIHKVLANAGVASRRNIEEMIRQGRVSVNGEVRTELPILVDPEDDQIEIDGERVQMGRRDTGPRLYIVMNKPKGVYSTNVSQGVQKRAIDLLPPNLPGRVYPVGRLDADSKGILLLTNDGDLTHKLTHPRFGVPKTYRAVVDGYIAPETTQRLEQGVWLADPNSGEGFKTGRSRIKITKRTRQFSVIEITIREGRNRQVRRMLAKLGHKVKDLTRVKFGPLTLEGLAPGRFRPLTKQEIRKLQSAGERRDKPKTDPSVEEPKRRGRKPAAGLDDD